MSAPHKLKNITSPIQKKKKKVSLAQRLWRTAAGAEAREDVALKKATVRSQTKEARILYIYTLVIRGAAAQRLHAV